MLKHTPDSSPGEDLARFRTALIDEGWCPECLGELDEGEECNACDYQAWKERYDHAA